LNKDLWFWLLWSHLSAKREIKFGGHYLRRILLKYIVIARLKYAGSVIQKGLYAKVDSGKIGEFTGITSPYEEPLSPEITLLTGEESVEESVNRLSRLIMSKVKIKGEP
jgi:hypothetical protein